MGSKDDLKSQRGFWGKSDAGGVGYDMVIRDEVKFNLCGSASCHVGKFCLSSASYLQPFHLLS